MISLVAYVNEDMESAGRKTSLEDLKNNKFPNELIEACKKYIGEEKIRMINRHAEFMNNATQKKIRQLGEMCFNLEKETYKEMKDDWSLYVYEYKDNAWISYNDFKDLGEYYFFKDK